MGIGYWNSVPPNKKMRSCIIMNDCSLNDRALANSRITSRSHHSIIVFYGNSTKRLQFTSWLYSLLWHRTSRPRTQNCSKESVLQYPPAALVLLKEEKWEHNKPKPESTLSFKLDTPLKDNISNVWYYEILLFADPERPSPAYIQGRCTSSHFTLRH